MSASCACVYDEYEIRMEVCRDCAAVLPQTIEDDRGRLQLNPDWLLARVGFATGSKAFDITKTIYKKGATEAGRDRAWSTKRGHYADQVIAERLTGKPQGIRKIYSLDERRDLETEARAAYAFYHDHAVREVGFIHHPFIERFGCSPDGFVGDDGMIEIKALDAANHIKLWEGDRSVIKEYTPQFRSGLACTSRSWLDFVSYCPQMLDEDLKLKVERFERDEVEISRLECSVRNFLAEVDKRVLSIQNRANGHEDNSLTAQLTGSVKMLDPATPSVVVPIKTKRKRTAVE